MKHIHTAITASSLFAMALTGSAAPAQAQAQGESEFPEREVRIVVPYGPGGANDQTARVIAQVINENNWLDEPVIVTNITGAAGREGLRAVANADPDGHTLLVQHTIFITAAHAGNLPEELHWDIAFEPIAQMLETPYAISVSVDSQWQSLDEMLQEISENPGEITVGLPTAVSSSTALLNLVLDSPEYGDLEVNRVIFQGGADTKAALLGGHVDAIVSPVIDVASEAQAEVIRPLVISSSERHPGLPDVATLAEAGYDVPEGGAGLNARMVIWAPDGVPGDVESELQDLMSRVFETEAWSEFVANQGVLPVFRTGEEVTEVFTLDTEVMEAMEF